MTTIHDVRAPSGPPLPTRPNRRNWGPLALLGLVIVGAVALSWFGTHRIYPYGTSNNDEPVYVHTAQVLAGGELTEPQATTSDGLRPWLSGQADGRTYSVFPPGWPLALALSLRFFGTTDVAVAAACAAVVLFGYLSARAATGNRRAALFAALTLAASPFVIVHGATRLSYLFALAIEFAVFWLILSARGQPRPTRSLLAGFAWGLLFASRPFDAVLFGACMVVFVIAGRQSNPQRSPLRTMGWWAAGGALPMLGVLAYNNALTGSPLQFPLSAAGGNNSFGWGPRHIVDGAPVVDATPRMAVGALRINLLELPHWLFGGVVIVPLVIVGAVLLARHDRAVAWFMGAITLIFPLAFVAYWGNILIVDGRLDLGPHYYLALLIPASLCAGAALDRIARSSRALAVGAVAALLVITVGLELPDKLHRAEVVTAAAQRNLDAVASANASVPGQPTTIIVPSGPDGAWVMHPRGELANAPGPPGPSVFIGDRGNDNLDVFDRFPDRAVFILHDGPPGADGLPRPVATHMERRSAAALELTTSLVNTSTSTLVDVTITGPGAGWHCLVNSSAPRLDVRWRVDASGPTFLDCLHAPEPIPPSTDITLTAGFVDNDHRTDVPRHFWTRTVGTDVQVGLPVVGDQGGTDQRTSPADVNDVTTVARPA